MAKVEEQSNAASENGKYWRNFGLGILAIGLLAEIAILAAGGAIIAGSGEIYRRANKPEQ